MLKTFERLSVRYVNGDKILFTLNAEQKNIFKLFGVSAPL